MSLFDNPALVLAIKVGAGLAAVQLLLGAILASPFASPIARREPAFIAHQLVTLPLMIYVSYLGCAGWFFPDEDAQELAATVEGRLYGRDPVGEELSAIVLGAMICWDIWATLLRGGHRNLVGSSRACRPFPPEALCRRGGEPPFSQCDQ